MGIYKFYPLIQVHLNLRRLQGSKSAQHCQTLRVLSTYLQVKLSRLSLTGKSIVLYCSGWSKLQ